MAYDRTALRAAACRKGDHTPAAIGRRLNLTPATAWRLYHGRTAPSGPVAARAAETYGIPATALYAEQQEVAA